MPDPSPKKSRVSTIRIVILSIVVGGLFVALKFLPLGDYVEGLLQWIDSLGAWGPVALAAIYVVATVAMVPGAILSLAAGFAFGLTIGVATVVVGSVLGATAAFLVGRSTARGFVEQKIEQYPRFAAIERAVEQSGFKVVLLTRLSPLFPFNALNYLFSVTSVRLRDYVLGSLFGMLPGIVMYVYFGTAVQNVAQLASGEIEGGVGRTALLAVGLAATIVVTLLIAKEARKALRSYAEATDEREPSESSAAR